MLFSRLLLLSLLFLLNVAAAPVTKPKFQCFIHGTMQDSLKETAKDVDQETAPKETPPAAESAKTGFSNLNYSIRLRWNVADEKVCAAIAQEYCDQRRTQGFIPKELVADFRDLAITANQLGPLKTYSIDPNCLVKELPAATTKK